MTMGERILANSMQLLLLSLQAVVAVENTNCEIFGVEDVNTTQRLVISDCLKTVTETDITTLVQSHNDVTEIQIINAKLTQMPSVLCDITDMTSLNLSHNLFVSFPACLSNLTHLRHLDMSHNALAELEGHDLAELGDLETLSLQYNQITYIYYDEWVFFNTSQLHSIYLNHNLIRSLPHDVIALPLDGVQRLDLSYNYFLCNCSDQWIKSWLEAQGHKILHKYEIMCSNSKTGGAFPLLKIKDMDKFTCDDSPHDFSRKKAELGEMILALIIILMTLPVIIGLICYGIHSKRRWIFYKTKWHPFDVDDCTEEDKQFDVFLSCAHQDEDWCMEKVKHFLEQRFYKVCWHREHFMPGEPILNSVGRCIESSKRTVCILTSHFIASPMCMREMEEAIAADFEKNHHRTIIILSKEVDISQLDSHVQRYLRTTTFIEKNSKKFYENLLYALPTKTIDGLIREYEVVVRDDIPLEEYSA